MRSLFLSQKTHSMLSSSVLSPSLTSLSLSRSKHATGGHSVARSARGMWRGLDGGGVGLGRWSMVATWGGLVGGLIWVYGVGWSWYVWRHGGVEAWRQWRFDRRWFFFVWVDRCWLIWCWFFFDFGWRSGGFLWSFDRLVWRSVSDLMAFGFWWWWW